MVRITNTANREAKKEETRQQFLKTAADIFAEVGYAQANINEISLVAGFGKGTIYNYFKNKKDLLSAIIRHACHETIEDVQEKLQGVTDPTEKIKIIIKNEIEWLEANESLGWVMIRAGYGASPQDQRDFLEALQEGYTFLVGVFQEGIDQGCFRKDLNPTFLTHLLFGIIETQLLAHWLLQDQYLPLDQLSDHIISIFMEGLKQGTKPEAWHH